MDYPTRYYVVIGLLVIGTTAGLWQVLKDHRHPTTSAPTTSDVAQSTPQSQRKAFSILRGPSEKLTPQMLEHIDETVGREVAKELEPTNAQLANRENVSAWLVPGNHLTCIAEPDQGSLACTSESKFIHYGLVLGVFKPPNRSGQRLRQFSVLGIAPDWATAARVKVGKNAIRNLAIHQNFYSVRANAPIHVLGLEP